jgi:hypothetical protein
MGLGRNSLEASLLSFAENRSSKRANDRSPDGPLLRARWAVAAVLANSAVRKITDKAADFIL